jgi:hypothetical protein
MVRGLLALLILPIVFACAGPLYGGIRMQIRDGRPLVDGVFVNGHGPYRFLIDTGTNVNLIGIPLAKAIGMLPTFETELGSAAGKIRAAGSDGNDVTLGAVHAIGQRFLFSSMEAIHRQNPDVRGVLGQSFLAGFDYLLDMRGQRLEFGKQIVTGQPTEFRVLNGRATVATSLGDLVLDSGVAGLVLFGLTGEGGELREVVMLAGSKRARIVASSLAIAGRDVWRGSALAIPENVEPGIAGLMPLSLFRSVYVCNSEGYVVFE